MMQVARAGGQPFAARIVQIPGSKSLTNRVLLAAALVDGSSDVVGALDAADTRAMLRCLVTLGVRVAGSLGGCLRVAPPVARSPHPVSLSLGAAATVARFLLPALGRWCAAGTAVALRADPQLCRRPLAPTLRRMESVGWRQLGGSWTEGNLELAVPMVESDWPPLTVEDEVSSQFASGAVFASWSTRGGLWCSRLPAVSAPYFEMTLAVAEAFGVQVQRVGGGVRVDAGAAADGWPGRRWEVEPDWASASYFLAAAAILGREVFLPGLRQDTLQPEVQLVAALEQMGCCVVWRRDGISLQGPQQLRGVEVCLRGCNDVAASLAAVAVWADTPSRISGLSNMRFKESERAQVFAAGLRRLGCGIELSEGGDVWTVLPQPPSRVARLDSEGDHRMAMGFAVAAARGPRIEILDSGCVVKTFPQFWELAGYVCSPEDIRPQRSC